MPAESLAAFVELTRHRRAARHFRSDAVDDDTLEAILEAGRWAPSGYNLQPTHLIVVRDAASRAALRPACMGQAQVTQAPVVVVVAGDRDVAARHFELVLKMDRESGAVSDGYEAMLRRFVPLAFSTGPLGIGWIWKSLMPLARVVAPVPSIPAVERRFWLAKQAALVAMNIMLAAESAGLATCPMEGFDERRVRRVLGMPRRLVPILVVPLGSAADTPSGKTRLPTSAIVHRERWTQG